MCPLTGNNRSHFGHSGIDVYSLISFVPSIVHILLDFVHPLNDFQANYDRYYLHHMCYVNEFCLTLDMPPQFHEISVNSLLYCQSWMCRDETNIEIELRRIL